MEKVTYVWKIKLSRPWIFDNDYWWSSSEVFVNVWPFLGKSIDEFSMLYKKCVFWYGLRSIITIWDCKLFNSTRFVLSIPAGYASHFLFHARVLWRANHSRPQSPSFLGHVVGYKLSRVALGNACKSAKKWYLMRMCISWLCPFKTLFQHCYAVLRSKSSLRIISCNITLGGSLTASQDRNSTFDTNMLARKGWFLGSIILRKSRGLWTCLAVSLLAVKQVEAIFIKMFYYFVNFYEL